MVETHLDQAESLTCDDRNRIIRRFFERHPGADRPPGLGRSLIDFVDWLTRSGRLHDTGGSRWWRALNGSLILDLAAVMEGSGSGRSSDTAGVNAWRSYADHGPVADPGEIQAALWRAHQMSLHVTIPQCWDLFDAEPEHERYFIEAAMEIVDLAALHSQPTDTAVLAESTRRLYPDHYPLDLPYGSDLARVRSAALRAHTGPVVGLHSEIWVSRRQAS